MILFRQYSFNHVDLIIGDRIYCNDDYRKRGKFVFLSKLQNNSTRGIPLTVSEIMNNKIIANSLLKTSSNTVKKAIKDLILKELGVVND